MRGIVYAAEEFADDCKFGEFVRKFLIRGGYIRKRGDGSYEAC